MVSILLGFILHGARVISGKMKSYFVTVSVPEFK